MNNTFNIQLGRKFILIAAVIIPSCLLSPENETLLLNTNASFATIGAGYGYVLRDHAEAMAI